MLLAGAGGHASEVLDVLLENEQAQKIYLFDNTDNTFLFKDNYVVLKSIEAVHMHLPSDFRFVLAIGDPRLRKKFSDYFATQKGKIHFFKSQSASISSSCKKNAFDAMKNCFVGPQTEIDFAALINTGAQVHHDVYVGKFSEISPRAVLLGGSRVGDYCRIGANATVLPKIKVGNNVVVGAGSVVTSNLPDNCVAVGVPAKIKRFIENV